MTRKMDLARGSKVFPPWKSFENEVAPHPPAGTEPHPSPYALARPQVDTLSIEFHEEDVRPAARSGLPIQGALREACHPGIANCVHLRQLVSWALQYAADARGKLKEKLRAD